ncbi:MAG: ABC transporter permease [Eubacteriales bacterium]
MKVLSIAKKIILRSLRDVNTMLIMCAMPLVIMFILGLAFDSMMGTDGNIELDDMYISYTIVGEKAQISEGIENMMDELLSDGSTYTNAENKQDELEKLKAANITAYIEIDENEQTIILYKNNKVDTSSSIVETALRSFAARYNTIVEIAKVNPMAVQSIMTQNESEEYITKVGLNSRYQPDAMDYYGVAMTILFILYGFLVPLSEVIADKISGLTSRVSVSPVKPAEKFIGSVLGYVSVTTIRTVIVIVMSVILYGVNWGETPIYPFLLIFAFIVVGTSMGMFLGEVFKSESAAESAAHFLIVVSAFFGGAYMALEDLGPIAEIGKYFSLIWWANTGITNQIYNNDYGNMISAFIIFGVLTIAFLGLSVIFMNRKEAYNNV